MGAKMSKDSNDTKIVSICSNCLITEDTVDFASCGNCKAIKYCSKLCQKADWKNHKRSCFVAIESDDVESLLINAQNYMFEEDYQKSKECFYKVMAFKSTTLNVRQYFEAMSGLGDISEKQSNFVDAEKIWIELIANTTSLRNSASTLLFMTKLAVAKMRNGKLGDAEALCNDCLKSDDIEECLRLSCQGTLANIFRSQRKYLESTKAYLEVLNGTEMYTESSTALKNNLANTYYEWGKLHDAERIFRECWTEAKLKFGDDNSSTLGALHNLGKVLLDLKTEHSIEEGEILLKECQAKRKKVLGLNHPHTLLTLNNLAQFYMDQERDLDAELTLKETLLPLKHLFGESHPNTLTVMHNLGVVLFEQNKLIEAKEVLGECINIKLSIYDENHPEVLASKKELTKVLEKIKS